MGFPGTPCMSFLRKCHCSIVIMLP
jgi:hypothetical protein